MRLAQPGAMVQTVFRASVASKEMSAILARQEVRVATEQMDYRAMLAILEQPE